MGIYGNKFNTYINEDSTLSIDISSIDTFCENTSILFDAFYNFFSITEAENITVYKASEDNFNKEEEKKYEKEDIIDGESKIVEIKKTFWNKIKELFSKIGNWFKEVFKKLADSIHEIYMKMNINDAIFRKFKETCSWNNVEEAIKEGKITKFQLQKLEFANNELDLEDSSLYANYEDYCYGEESWFGDGRSFSSSQITRKFDFVIDKTRDIDPILEMDDEKAEDFYKEFKTKIDQFKKDFAHKNYFRMQENNLKGRFLIKLNEKAFDENGKLKDISNFKEAYDLTLKIATEGDIEIKKYASNSKDFLKKYKLDESTMKKVFKESKKAKDTKIEILYNKMNWEFTAAFVSALMSQFRSLIFFKRIQHTSCCRTIFTINKILNKNKGGK